MLHSISAATGRASLMFKINVIVRTQHILFHKKQKNDFKRLVKYDVKQEMGQIKRK